MVNEVTQAIIGGAAILISLLTFVLSATDRAKHKEQDVVTRLRSERDAAILRAEAAEKRADEYADAYFHLREGRNNPK